MAMPPDILCIGAVLWDVIGRAPGPVALGDDLPGRITRAPGGVALNIAVTLAQLGLRPALLAAVGRDAAGDDLVAACRGLGLVTDYITRTDLPTDAYLAVEGANGLIAAIADARGLEAAGGTILHPLVDGTLGSVTAPWAGPMALDGNLTAALLADIARHPAFARADLRLAPASPDKALRLAPLLTHPGATFYVNLAEARLLARIPAATASEAAVALVALGATRVLVTDGGNPCADAARGAALLTATPPPVQVAKVTGAGDAFMAAHIAAERRGGNRQQALASALAAAARHISEEIGP